MREVNLSNCEREFIREAILQDKRIDGRNTYEFRNIDIKFGSELGFCQVSLGKTRTIAQVTCEVVAPQVTRPSEGHLSVNVELNSMAAPEFEPGKPSEIGIEITRIVERAIKESRCIDLEALCISTGSKVWQIRVDVHVLNHDGNMTDCACIAAMVSLMHFKHPDVTVSGEDICIHPVEKRDPIALSIHHIPICITFSFFNQGTNLLVDPNEHEENAAEGKMIFGMNSHREMCTLHLGGSMLVVKDQVLRCAEIAAKRSIEITGIIKKCLASDSVKRKSGESMTYAKNIKNIITANRLPVHYIKHICSNNVQNNDLEIENEASKAKVSVKGQGTASMEIGDGGDSTWVDNVNE